MKGVIQSMATILSLRLYCKMVALWSCTSSSTAAVCRDTVWISANPQLKTTTTLRHVRVAEHFHQT